MGRCRWKIWKSTLSRSQIPESGTLFQSEIFLNNTLTLSIFRQNCALQRKFVRNVSKNLEISPFKWFESHSQNANGLKRPFGVKNNKYGPCHRIILYKNDTLSRSRNPENDTLFSGTSVYRKYMSTPSPVIIILHRRVGAFLIIPHFYYVTWIDVMREWPAQFFICFVFS